MYAICDIIYGLPLCIDTDNGGRTELIDECIDYGGWDRDDDFPKANSEGTVAGFYSPYSGGGSISPGAFGIILDRFDEGSHHVEISPGIELTPNQSQIDEYNKVWKNLPDDVKSDLGVFGEPRVFLLWSTS